MIQATYAVEAYNLSQASENKIHDDSVARRFGFEGGLVPGVEVYAYATHLAVARWGRSWLEGGSMSIRFLKPVYDGLTAIVTALDVPGEEAVALHVACNGTLSATARADIRAPATDARGHLDGAAIASPLVDRPPADETSLAEGRLLRSPPQAIGAAELADYLAAVREQHDLYERDGIVHPGQILRVCNLVLKENVLLPPWVHTGSQVQNLSLARVGETLEGRARIERNYKKKGHHLVDLDVLVTADTRPVARVLHTAIYRLRGG
ncbi:MAG TPA: hypothetical protein PK264_06995 [Hyphomicrobiaceae bacterium]|nr:hypothetical protein [Hyphomicrobiaceae bacterium]